MIDLLIEYLFPATYFPFVQYLPAPVFWVIFVRFREEIGLWGCLAWGFLWIALFLAFMLLEIKTAFYFPVQVIIAILLAIAARYKALVSG